MDTKYMLPLQVRVGLEVTAMKAYLSFPTCCLMSCTWQSYIKKSYPAASVSGNILSHPTRIDREIDMDTNTHTYIHTHAYIYIYIYMCVCVCVCVWRRLWCNTYRRRKCRWRTQFKSLTRLFVFQQSVNILGERNESNYSSPTYE